METSNSKSIYTIIKTDLVNDTTTVDVRYRPGTALAAPKAPKVAR